MVKDLEAAFKAHKWEMTHEELIVSTPNGEGSCTSKNLITLKIKGK